MTQERQKMTLTQMIPSFYLYDGPRMGPPVKNNPALLVSEHKRSIKENVSEKAIWFLFLQLILALKMA